MFRNRALPFTAAFAAIASCALFTTAATAATLTGSGTHLPIPNPNPGAPNDVSATRTQLTSGFTGTWASPADSDWWGTFKASGPIPTNGDTGTTDYGFGGLVHGYLPTGTFFHLGDVDYGSQNAETFTLSAFAGDGTQLTSPWLNQPIGVWGTGNGTGGVPDATDMPGWAFNNTTGVYTFNGNTVTGPNPGTAIALMSNVPIYQLLVVKNSGFNGFHLAAPTAAPLPASLPAALALLALCGLGLLIHRGRQTT